MTSDGTLSIIGSGLSDPRGVAVDANGNVYIADTYHNEVKKLTPGGTLSIIAGNGNSGPPTAGPATSSDLNNPAGVAVDANGNVYIADSWNNEVEKVTPGGTLSIIAGTGASGPPTAGPATSSDLNDPLGLASDANGNVYIADSLSDDVVKVTSGGTLSIIAGTGSSGPPTAGQATSSDLDTPFDVGVDANGNVYIADTHNNELERVTPGGTLSIITGTGTGAAPSYGAAATTSAVDGPGGVAVDTSGVLYIADSDNNTIDRVGPAAPAAPTILTATPGQGNAALVFDPPVSLGTSPISGYEASSDDGATWQSITTTSGSAGSLQATLSGLSPASTYTILLRADNSSGAGPASNAESVTLPPASTTTTTTATTNATSATMTTTAASTAATTTTTSATTTSTSRAVASLPPRPLTVTIKTATSGKLRLRVHVPAPGTIEVIATGADPADDTSFPASPSGTTLKPGKRRFIYARASVAATKSGPTTIKLHLTAAGRAIIARHLAHGWGLHVRVVVAYIPSGGQQVSTVKKIKIVLAHMASTKRR